MKVVVINGHPRAGKDTFVKFCQEILGTFRCRNLSTIDYIKKIAPLFGWREEKTPEARRFLAKLKDITTEYNDFSYRYIKKQFSAIEKEEWNGEDIIVFVHCREPKDIERFVRDYNAITVLVKNKRVEDEYSNEADANVENYRYDVTILNNTTLDNLKLSAKAFIEYLAEEKKS